MCVIINKCAKGLFCVYLMVNDFSCIEKNAKKDLTFRKPLLSSSKLKGILNRLKSVKIFFIDKKEVFLLRKKGIP